MKKQKSLRQLAGELGVSPSYLSMIRSGQRKCPSELMEKLKSIPDVHKVVNFQLRRLLHTQEVTGSNPVLPTTPIIFFAAHYVLSSFFGRLGEF